MNCIICGSYSGERADAKFCSDKCRKMAERDGSPVRSKDPLKRITDTRNIKVKDGYFFFNGDRYEGDYYKSRIFNELMEELLAKPISQLEAEGYFIPAWKYNNATSFKVKGKDEKKS